jgi:hypothetical protein
MSITDELRERAHGFHVFNEEMLLAIADRIDAEHQKAIRELNNLADASVLLPVDADGVPWHIGDRTESGQTIEAMGLNKHGWHFVGTVNEIDPSIHRHYHAPTVEDVLREFAYGLGVPVADSYVAATAAKLRLAEEDE